MENTVSMAMERKPEWLKVSYHGEAVEALDKMLDDLSLNTVCREADCPNMGECFKKRTATFLVMGRNCTRGCRFCNVTKETPAPLDEREAGHILEAVEKMGLRHIVITSVTRDDIVDGGARHFANIVRVLKENAPEVTVELLIPDLCGSFKALETVIESCPDILGHNVETVPALYARVRPEADYRRSIAVLRHIKHVNPDMVTKTGIMVGLGETEEQVFEVMDDILSAHCDILTIGQYLQPSKDHLRVQEYVTPGQFQKYAEVGTEKGIRYVYSAPLVRSSYHAEEAFAAYGKVRSL